MYDNCFHRLYIRLYTQKKHTRNAQDMIYVCTYTYVHICIQSFFFVNTHKTHVHKLHARTKFYNNCVLVTEFGSFLSILYFFFFFSFDFTIVFVVSRSFVVWKIYFERRLFSTLIRQYIFESETIIFHYRVAQFYWKHFPFSRFNGPTMRLNSEP